MIYCFELPFHEGEKMKKSFGVLLAVIGISIISIATDLPVEQTLKFGLGLFTGGVLMVIGWLMI